MADQDFGQDFSTFVDSTTGPDLDPTFSPIVGSLAVAETVARGLLMPKGQLVDIGDTQKAGFDIRAFLSVRITNLTLMQIKVGCEREALLDERVRTATAVVSYDTAASKITVEMHGTTNKGPFELVVAVGKLSTELLKAS